MKIVRRPVTSETCNRIACSYKHCHKKCLHPWLTNVYTVNSHGDTHEVMKLVLVEKRMALHTAVNGSSVYRHQSRSQVNDWYQIWTRMFEILLSLPLRVGTYVGSMIWKLCISHVYCLIFALCTYIFLIFSFIRLQTRNWNWSMTWRSWLWTRHIGEKRRAS